ncbi:hypothetical protein H8D85_00465 [bacterium]|nr:hypothetical protein [bacterium]
MRPTTTTTKELTQREGLIKTIAEDAVPVAALASGLYAALLPSIIKHAGLTAEEQAALTLTFESAQKVIEHLGDILLEKDVMDELILLDNIARES